MSNTVILAGDTDISALSAVIAEAFHDLPPSRWLIADDDARRQVFPAYFRIYVEQALACGTVHTTPDRDAVALWLPVPGMPPPPGYLSRLTAVTGPWASRFLALDSALDTHHPTCSPHYHLAILAVRPGRQNRGTGTALLDAWHHNLDEHGQAAYLEASSEQSRDLYLRHGYRLGPEGPFFLPDDGPAFWPMWREPRPVPSALATGRETGHGKAP